MFSKLYYIYTQLYYLCTIPVKVRFGGTGFMEQNYTIHWKIHHTANRKNATCIIRKCRFAFLWWNGWISYREKTEERALRFGNNAQGTIHAYRQKGASWISDLRICRSELMQQKAVNLHRQSKTGMEKTAYNHLVVVLAHFQFKTIASCHYLTV